jgi:hypothetical protein
LPSRDELLPSHDELLASPSYLFGMRIQLLASQDRLLASQDELLPPREQQNRGDLSIHDTKRTRTSQPREAPGYGSSVHRMTVFCFRCSHAKLESPTDRIFKDKKLIYRQLRRDHLKIYKQQCLFI